VTEIFHSGRRTHGGDRTTFEVMISTYPRGTLGSVASLLAATLYQGNPARNQKHWIQKQSYNLIYFDGGFV